MILKIRNEKNRKLGTIENVFNNAFEKKKDKDKTISTTRIILEIPDVLVIQYQWFNKSSVPNKMADYVKYKFSVTFNNILYNLKGIILHTGDTIENGKYYGIFSDNIFDNIFTDNILIWKYTKTIPRT